MEISNRYYYDSEKGSPSSDPRYGHLTTGTTLRGISCPHWAFVQVIRRLVNFYRLRLFVYTPRTICIRAPILTRTAALKTCCRLWRVHLSVFEISFSFRSTSRWSTRTLFDWVHLWFQSRSFLAFNHHLLQHQRVEQPKHTS